MKNILAELNSPQREAVENIHGPTMVIAGAGSGKTRVLTYRIAHLINQGVDPFHILALTFTNKAAREMKERISRLIGGSEALNVWMGTFHSVFARVLRIEAIHLGYTSNFTIYDTDDSKSLIRKILNELQLDSKIYQPNYIQHKISWAKSNLINAIQYSQIPNFYKDDVIAGKARLGEIYLEYQKRLKASNSMDFDDLLFYMDLMLSKFPELLLKYQKKFQYILVDEYQDTNHAQYRILKMLASRDENICVVGDDAQSIYSFRGANIQNILNFQKDYPDLKIIKLEQNYRSTQAIVNIANSLIINNKDQIFKEIWTDNVPGNPVKILKAPTDNEEGTIVARSIFEIKMNNQLQNKAFSILYRTNAQSRAFEEALRKLNIHYKIFGGLSFYRRKEIKDLLAYFRLVINNNDEEALHRIINYPARGIGKTTIDRITIAAKENNKSYWEVMESLSGKSLGIPFGTVNKINEFQLMIKSFSVKQNEMQAYELAMEIANQSGILKELHADTSPEGVSHYENLVELLNGISEFSDNKNEDVDLLQIQENGNSIKSLQKYMQDISLLTDADTSDNENMDYVSLMTIHQAKGLEFPYVFVVGMEEDLFPNLALVNSRADLEEERRLFYVALTRAETQAILTYAETRYRWGNLTFPKPSRFLEELDPKYIEFPRKLNRSGVPTRNLTEKNEKAVITPVSKPKNLKKLSELARNTYNEINRAIVDEIAYQSGMEVEHDKFGKGKILVIEGEGPNKKATVFFAGIGQKQLLLKFAKLRILE